MVTPKVSTATIPIADSLEISYILTSTWLTMSDLNDIWGILWRLISLLKYYQGDIIVSWRHLSLKLLKFIAFKLVLFVSKLEPEK